MHHGPAGPTSAGTEHDIQGNPRTMDKDDKLNLGDAEADVVRLAGVRSGEGLATDAAPAHPGPPEGATVHHAGIRSGAELEEDEED